MTAGLSGNVVGSRTPTNEKVAHSAAQAFKEKDFIHGDVKERRIDTQGNGLHPL